MFASIHLKENVGKRNGKRDKEIIYELEVIFINLIFKNIFSYQTTFLTAQTIFLKIQNIVE